MLKQSSIIKAVVKFEIKGTNMGMVFVSNGEYSLFAFGYDKEYLIKCFEPIQTNFEDDDVHSVLDKIGNLPLPGTSDMAGVCLRNRDAYVAAKYLTPAFEEMAYKPNICTLKVKQVLDAKLFFSIKLTGMVCLIYHDIEKCLQVRFLFSQEQLKELSRNEIANGFHESGTLIAGIVAALPTRSGTDAFRVFGEIAELLATAFLNDYNIQTVNSAFHKKFDKYPWANNARNN